MMRVRFALPFLLCLLVPIDSVAQSVYESKGWLAIAKHLLPASFAIGYDLRDFLASEEFLAYSQSHSADEAFDRIYLESLVRAHGDIEAALLGAAIGTFDHYSLPLNIGIRINIPLTLESRERFERRVRNLPAGLYRSTIADRDKPQHFYASAWLKQALGMEWLVDLFGEAVEIGEDNFVAGSSNDRRDVAADKDGARFGFSAEPSGRVLPSQFLTREE